MTTPTACHWCISYEPSDPDSLCLPHRAEWEGLSVAELERRENEWAAELEDLYPINPA